MPVLAIVEVEGDADALKRASDAACQAIGMPPGLLARVVAPTESGIVLVNVWASEVERQASNADPGHRGALEASGLPALTRSRTARFLETDWVELAGGSAPAPR